MVDLEQLKYGKVSLKPNLTRNVHYCHTAVVMVGCGGTGGRIIPLLAQHIANHNKEIATNPRHNLYINHEMTLVLYDSKIVLPKNLDRQNFFQFDLGKNKAQVMAERYGALYGINIVYKPNKWDGDVTHPGGHSFRNAIIFDCTDNKVARQSIEDHLPANNNVIISCGNEADFGQVLYSFKTRSGWGSNRASYMLEEIDYLEDVLSGAKTAPKETQLKYVPTILELFRDFKDTPTASCDEVILVNEQSMPINSLVGQIAYNVFYDVVSGKSLNYNMVKCNVNNVFSTSFVSKPTAALRLYYRGLFGIDDMELSRAALAEFKVVKKDRGLKNPTVVKEFAEKYPIHCGPLFEKAITEYGYNFEVNHSGSLKEYIEKSKVALKEYLGVTEDATV